MPYKRIKHSIHYLFEGTEKVVLLPLPSGEGWGEGFGMSSRSWCPSS